MKLNKEQIEKIRKYAGYFLNIKDTLGLNATEFANLSSHNATDLINRKRSGEEISEDEILKQLGRFMASLAAGNASLTSQSYFGKEFELDTRVYMQIQKILRTKNVPDDIEYDTKTKETTTNKDFDQENIYESIEEYIDFLKKDIKIEFDYKKEAFENEDKTQEYLKDLIISSKEFADSLKGLKSSEKSDKIMSYAFKAIPFIEKALAPDTPNEERAAEAHKAMYIYFFGKTNDVDDPEIKAKLMKAFDLDQNEFDAIGSMILRKPINTSEKKLSDQEVEFKRQMNEKFANFAKAAEEALKDSIKESFNKEKTGKDKVDGLMNGAAIYKNQKDKYSGLFKSWNVFKLIKNYFSKEAKDLRQNMKDIEKGFKENNIDVKKADQKDFFGSVGKMINGLNIDQGPKIEEKVEDQPQKKTVKGLEEKFAPKQEKEAVKNKEEVQKEAKTVEKQK